MERKWNLGGRWRAPTLNRLERKDARSRNAIFREKHLWLSNHLCSFLSFMINNNHYFHYFIYFITLSLFKVNGLGDVQDWGKVAVCCADVSREDREVGPSVWPTSSIRLQPRWKGDREVELYARPSPEWVRLLLSPQSADSRLWLPWPLKVNSILAAL